MRTLQGTHDGKHHDPESVSRIEGEAPPAREQQGCSLEALARSILDHAAEDLPVDAGFPDNLIALVEPGEDIEPFLREHRQPQEPIDLS